MNRGDRPKERNRPRGVRIDESFRRGGWRIKANDTLRRRASMGSPSRLVGAAMQQMSSLVLGLFWHYLMFDQENRGL
jgi:hypothetical protein